MIETTDMFLYLGYVIIAVLIYLIFNIILKHNKEGFGIRGGDKDYESQRLGNLVDEIKGSTERMKDQMNVKKYRKDWENIIIALEDGINTQILSSLPHMAQQLEKSSNDEELTEMAKKLNNMNTFRTTLNDSMKFLDGLK
tara:strand:+ start:6657 stop:7076 length:420 start_codon:yes stop_codon:yes gene_type:complete